MFSHKTLNRTLSVSARAVMRILFLYAPHAKMSAKKFHKSQKIIANRELPLPIPSTTSGSSPYSATRKAY